MQIIKYFSALLFFYLCLTFENCFNLKKKLNNYNNSPTNRTRMLNKKNLPQNNDNDN